MTSRPTLTDASGRGQFMPPEYVPVDERHLDPRNPRFQQVGDGLDERQILEIL